MSTLELGPTGRRRGRGARERILQATVVLFRDQGINKTGIEQICEVAQVSKRTAYQHFGGKDGLIEAYLRFHQAAPIGALDRTDLLPRERLLAVFQDAPGDESPPMCPFIGAAVEISDPCHPGRGVARTYKQALTTRLADTARDAGARDPEVLGDQLALLLDGAAARTRTTGTNALPAAVSIAKTLIDQALGADDEVSSSIRSM